MLISTSTHDFASTLHLSLTSFVEHCLSMHYFFLSPQKTCTTVVLVKPWDVLSFHCTDCLLPPTTSPRALRAKPDSKNHGPEKGCVCSYPSDDGEEGEGNGSPGCVCALVERQLVSRCPRPLIGQEAETYKVQEGPGTCQEQEHRYRVFIFSIWGETLKYLFLI